MKLWPPTFEPYTAAKGSTKNVVTLMSGGVDSSVTALTLKRDGWNVIGVTMKIPYAEGCDYKRSCCGVQAAYVCQALDIPHYYMEVREEFENLVIAPFREWYLRGETPSPCVDCNTLIKFQLAWDCLRDELGVENLATGHYARVVHTDGETYLARASDLSRDQSYFLYGIKRDRLPKLILPLGDKSKTEVRKIARSAKLPVAGRQDSMELCFSGEADYRNALDEQAKTPGPILDPSGAVIGRHDGIANYTIGQRKGIGVAARDPLFVVGIDPEDNSITVGGRALLYADIVRAREANILIPEYVRPGGRLFGKIRSQGEPTACVVGGSDKSDVSDASDIIVRFDVPVFAPTPGQRLVLYDDQRRLAAGGVITRPGE